MKTLRESVVDFAALLRAEAAELELAVDDITVFSAAVPYCCFQIEAAERQFEIAITYREGLRCWEITAGHQRSLLPPAVGPVCGEPVHLCRNALRLIKHALRDPDFAFGEPQVV